MTSPGASAALQRVRSACSVLPEVVERPSHGAPSFFVSGKRCFVMFMDNHHDDGRLALWCAAPLGVQESVIEEDPERFFRPPYVGTRGWFGLRLDRAPDWEEVAVIVKEAYRCVAPKTLAALLGPT